MLEENALYKVPFSVHTYIVLHFTADSMVVSMRLFALHNTLPPVCYFAAELLLNGNQATAIESVAEASHRLAITYLSNAGSWHGGASCARGDMAGRAARATHPRCSLHSHASQG